MLRRIITHIPSLPSNISDADNIKPKSYFLLSCSQKMSSRWEVLTVGIDQDDNDTCDGGQMSDNE